MVEFHEDAITEGCREGLEILSQHDFVDDFYLAGGTALALQLGHWVSTDLDWFSTTNILPESERQAISQDLTDKANFEIVSQKNGMLYIRLKGTDVSLIHQRHSLLEPTVDYKGLNLASPVDIGLMKIAAVNSRGSRRDFVDLYCLQEAVLLDRILERVPEKYSDRPNFLAIAARALSYFGEAEQQPMPKMLRNVAWTDVKSYCADAANRLTRRLSRFDG